MEPCHVYFSFRKNAKRIGVEYMNVNCKSEKGITLVALMITIIITLIIAAVATSSGIATNKKAKYYNAISQLKTVQYEVNSMYEKYKNGDKDIILVGEEISDSTVTSDNKKVKELSKKAFSALEVSEEQQLKYRYFSKEYLTNTLDINGITYDFIIDVSNRDVILLKGVKYENKIYYSLSQLENEQYNVKYVEENNTANNTTNNNTTDENTENIEENVLKPKISGKEMIPVVWNKSILSWVKADVTWNETEQTWEQNKAGSWYNYSKDEKKWANIVTVAENGTNSREYYEQAKSGTRILETDITTMFVWIPRYEYKSKYYTDNTYSTQADDETLYEITDINFLSKDSNITDGYQVNSAFSYVNSSNETVNIEGFWMGKFETANATTKKINDNIGKKYGWSNNSLDELSSYIAIKPLVTSWRKIALNGSSEITVTSAIDVSNKDSKNIYGLGSSAEMGLLTDEMWNAVAMLSQSEYGNIENGKNGILYGNFYYEGDGTENTSYYTTISGMVCEMNSNDYTELNNKDITKLIKVSKEAKNGLIKINDKYTYYEYWTEIGNKSSTSSNVYGVFDMIGGSADYTVDKEGNYYIRGGRFYDTDLNNINIFSKILVSNIEDNSRRTCTFRTGLVVK